MSGGYIEYAHLKEPNQLLSGYYEKELRRAADQLTNDEDWVPRWADELTEDERVAMAGLLRTKAAIIEDARDTIEQNFEGDFQRLLKGIDYAGAGDYGPDEVAERWREMY